ncbi:MULTISPECIES: hypothetical protein [Actibacterium]|uniref:Uncharacterized protein n=1 Tax=Actibacterium naphthalenivorans TaxID=1614693 RepID=A0A840CA52_9RHOB|nr:MULTISPECIES: hypothetical protein [Actibacterium]ALG89846.1 hypothetical protein TQ29_06105 [Actibacterium sp. EMB200-NS6]MBB4020438.1 hypothetical protein [Actibacterium naphthalenivorans]
MTHPALNTLRGVALLILTAPAALALPGSPSQRAEFFATCAGRLAALETRQRATQSPDVGKTEALRADFDLLLEATLPDAVDYGMPPAQATQWRSLGWGEIATLLADADYSFDAGRAARARQMIDRRILDCNALILPNASGD